MKRIKRKDGMRKKIKKREERKRKREEKSERKKNVRSDVHLRNRSLNKLNLKKI